jgi:hypothetical protein
VLRVSRAVRQRLCRTFKQLALAMLTIACMLGLAYLMNYSGMTSTLGLRSPTPASLPVLQRRRRLARRVPHRQRHLGQRAVRQPAGRHRERARTQPVLTASVNSAAGVMGKMISVQSIAVAVAATGMTSADESKLFRFTIKHSVLLMIVMAIVSMLYAYVFPGCPGRAVTGCGSMFPVHPFPVRNLNWEPGFANSEQGTRNGEHTAHVIAIITPSTRSGRLTNSVFALTSMVDVA